MILWLQTRALKTRFMAVLLAFLTVLACFYAIYSTPWFLVQLKQYSPDASLPDLLWWYEPSQLHSMLGAWGVVGRDFYRTTLFPLDLVFPLVYGSFFSLALFYLLKKINPRFVWFYLLPVLPFAGVLFDLLENAAIFVLSVLYPDPSPELSTVAATLTAAKWAVVALDFVALVSLALWHWLQRVKALLSPPV